MLPPGTIEAFGLFLVRTSALILAAPLLGTGATFSGYRVGLIGVLSVVFFLAAGTPTIPEVHVVGYGIFALREIMVGLTLAFLLHVVVLAVRVSSELIGHEMAFNISRIVDPATGASVPVVAHMYELLFFLAFLSVDGHLWMVRALMESFGRAPVGNMALSENVPGLMVDQFGQLFAAGITFAAPVLVLLMMISITIGLLTRAVPQINVMEFGFNLRISGGLVAMFLFAPVLAPALDRLLARLMDGLNAGLDALAV